MPGSSSQYEPLQLLECSSNGSLVIHENNLTNILATVADVPLSIVTVNGPRGSGKSLLTGCILKYLQNLGDPNWLDPNSDTPVNEQKWPQGSSPDSPSLWGFNPPVLIDNPDSSQSTKIAILVLYTHTSHEIHDNSILSSIGGLLGIAYALSSHLIVILHKEITEECLNTFCSYLKHSFCFTSALPSADPTLSSVSFLIRDSNPTVKFAYGNTGGTDYLKLEKLKMKPSHSRISIENRRLVGHFVNDLSGCLLPYPGHNVIQNNSHDVNLEDMEHAFVEHMKSFVENIIKKATSNKKMTTGRQFANELKICHGWSTVNDEMKPEAATCLQSANISIPPSPMEQEIVIQEAVKKFVHILKTQLKGKDYLKEHEIRNVEKRARAQVEITFREAADKAFHGLLTENGPKNPNIISILRRMHQKLNEKLKNQFERFQADNSKKRVAHVEQVQLGLLQHYTNFMSSWSVKNHSNNVAAFLKDSGALIRDLVAEFETTASEDDGENFKEKLLDEEALLKVEIFGRKVQQSATPPVPRPRRH